MYKGLGPVMVGSAPSGKHEIKIYFPQSIKKERNEVLLINALSTASLFFITYEGVKVIFQPRVPEQYHAFIHMSAASLGELVINTLIQNKY